MCVRAHTGNTFRRLHILYASMDIYENDYFSMTLYIVCIYKYIYMYVQTFFKAIFLPVFQIRPLSCGR